MAAPKTEKVEVSAISSDEQNASGVILIMPHAHLDPASADYRHRLADLFHEHRDRLVRFLMVRLESRAEAEEIAQEAFLKLIELRQAVTDKNLAGLLYTTARNLATDRLRQRRRRNNTGENWGPDHVVTPEQILSGRQDLARLQDLLTALPSKCSYAFLSYKIHGHSYAEIAEKMKLTESMVRKYVLRAVAYCAAHLDIEAEDR